MTDYFRFKHFTIWQDECAMKVGTDGVLLSAWASSLLSTCHAAVLDRPTASLLDIGTGTGLIAMHLSAEHPDIKALAIDIDPQSAAQAQKNVEAAGMSHRIEVRTLDFARPEAIKELTDTAFDIIVSNPPFYEEDTHNRDRREDTAKHTTTLTFAQLTAGIDTLMSRDGVAYLIVPYPVGVRLIALCAEHCLYLTHRCAVYTSMRNHRRQQPQRVLLAFRRTLQPTITTDLVLTDEDGTPTQQFRQLTSKMYEEK